MYGMFPYSTEKQKQDKKNKLTKLLNIVIGGCIAAIVGIIIFSQFCN